MEGEYFQAALHRFIKENANGGAIRHLADRGLSAEEIKEHLDFPMDLSEIKQIMEEHLAQEEDK